MLSCKIGLTGFLGFLLCNLPLIRASGNNNDFSEPVVFDKILLEGNTSFGIIEDIQQDSIGFIWIGAKDGLYRYDGIHFHSYFYERRDSFSLSNSVVTDLFCDHEGTLWIATENGFNRYDSEHDRFIRYFAYPNSSVSMIENHIVRADEDACGNLWLATAYGGLLKYDRKTDAITRFNSADPNGLPVRSDFLRTLFIDSEGLIWVGTIDNGVFGFSEDGKNFRSINSGPQDGKHISGSNVRSIAEYPKGILWFGTNANGISRYDKVSGKITYYNTAQKKQYIASDAIWNLFLDSRENLWACTDGGGLNRYDRSSGAFVSYRYSKKDPKSISSDVVRVFYEDNAGNYWVGNFNAALNYVDIHPKKFHIFRSASDLGDEEKSNLITSVLRSSENVLWVGTDGGGLLMLDSSMRVVRKFTHQPGNSNSLPNNKPLCLERDNSGKIWIGTYEGGLSCYQPRDNRFINYYPDGTNHNPRGTQIWDLLLISNKLWIASDRGVDILDLTTGIFRFIPIDKSEGKGTNVTGSWYLFKDARGRILIGTTLGLNVFDPVYERFTYFEPILNDTTSISDKWILTIFEDSQNRIWIGTNGGGLNLWKEPDGFISFNMKDGLPGNVINHILEDEENNLWISTNNGLTRFNYDNRKITVFTTDDGLQDNRFSINAAYKDPDGILYFGGINGLTYFDPSLIISNSVIPAVVLTHFELFNKQVNIHDPKSPLLKNIMHESVINLNYKQRVFAFQFASLNFTQPNKNSYKYRLEGFEEDWNQVGNQHWATYTNIPAGDYTFHVIASNNDDVWNTKGASIHVVIHPPFYRTIWFIGLLLLLSISLIYGVYRLRVRDMRSINRNLSALVTERTAEIEKRNREIIAQSEEITRQRDIATTQRDQIILQNEEMEKHRSRLEELVKERTLDLVAAKEKAEGNDRLKTAFLENISHQIRTPMNAILGFINLLAEKIDDKSAREYYLRIVNESGRSMLRLVEDIIDFSRMQTGQLQPEYNECDLQQLIKDIVSSFRTKASREKPELSILADLAQSPTIIYTDERKLTQILMKLLENSYKFTEKGHICVGAKSIGENEISFFVEDSGKGIEEDSLGKIFDQFFFIPEQDSVQASRGSGLGLAFAKTVAEMLGGKIWAESNSNAGIIFCFSIPNIKPDDAVVKFSPSKKPQKFYWPGKRILVAEDEESNFLLIEAILKDSGIILIRANDGVELLEILEKEEYVDLVLLDIKMPRMNGINAMKILRDSNPSIPVIAQTAYDQAHYRELCKEHGCDDFLIKPIRKAELLEAIKSALGKK